MELIRTAAAPMEEDFSLPAVEEEDAGIVPITLGTKTPLIFV
jgi:hypothetical protein